MSWILVAVDLIFLHGKSNCPSITIARAWWYLGIIRSADVPANRASINVWWWSTLINQWRLVGRLPGSKEYPGRYLERQVVALQCPRLPSKKKAGKGQSALYLPFRPGFRSEKRKAGARCSESQSDMDVTLWCWPRWTPPLWKALESLLYDHSAHREAMGVSSLKALSVCCCQKLQGTFS